MPIVIARLVLKSLLASPDTKKKIVAALRDAAKKTDTKIDDAAVDTVEAIWDVVVPILVGK